MDNILLLMKKPKTDKERMVYCYHQLKNSNLAECNRCFDSINPNYLKFEIYKDLSRSLLCWALSKHQEGVPIYKEAEYFIVIKRLCENIDLLNCCNKKHLTDVKAQLFDYVNQF